MATSKKVDAPAEIYALIDPRTDAVRYIGKATNSVRRFKDHLRENRRKTPVYAWIAKLRGLGMVPSMAVICMATTRDWQSLERIIIAQYRTSTNCLLNVADGGDQPHCSDDTRLKNGLSLVARISTDPIFARVCAIKKHMGTALKLGLVPERTKEKLRECARKRPDMFGDWASI